MFDAKQFFYTSVKVLTLQTNPRRVPIADVAVTNGWSGYLAGKNSIQGVER
jgi:hypothetical protein